MKNEPNKYYDYNLKTPCIIFRKASYHANKKASSCGIIEDKNKILTFDIKNEKKFFEKQKIESNIRNIKKNIDNLKGKSQENLKENIMNSSEKDVKSVNSFDYIKPNINSNKNFLHENGKDFIYMIDNIEISKNRKSDLPSYEVKSKFLTWNNNRRSSQIKVTSNNSFINNTFAQNGNIEFNSFSNNSENNNKCIAANTNEKIIKCLFSSSNKRSHNEDHSHRINKDDSTNIAAVMSRGNYNHNQSINFDRKKKLFLIDDQIIFDDNNEHEKLNVDVNFKNMNPVVMNENFNINLFEEKTRQNESRKINNFKINNSNYVNNLNYNFTDNLNFHSCSNFLKYNSNEKIIPDNKYSYNIHSPNDFGKNARLIEIDSKNKYHESNFYLNIDKDLALPNFDRKEDKNNIYKKKDENKNVIEYKMMYEKDCGEKELNKGNNMIEEENFKGKKNKSESANDIFIIKKPRKNNIFDMIFKNNKNSIEGIFDVKENNKNILEKRKWLDNKNKEKNINRKNSFQCLDMNLKNLIGEETEKHDFISSKTSREKISKKLNLFKLNHTKKNKKLNLDNTNFNHYDSLKISFIKNPAEGASKLKGNRSNELSSINCNSHSDDAINSFPKNFEKMKLTSITDFLKPRIKNNIEKKYTFHPKRNLFSNLYKEFGFLVNGQYDRLIETTNRNSSSDDISSLKKKPGHTMLIDNSYSINKKHIIRKNSDPLSNNKHFKLFPDNEYSSNIKSKSKKCISLKNLTKKNEKFLSQVFITRSEIGRHLNNLFTEKNLLNSINKKNSNINKTKIMNNNYFVKCNSNNDLFKNSNKKDQDMKYNYNNFIIVNKNENFNITENFITNNENSFCKCFICEVTLLKNELYATQECEHLICFYCGKIFYEKKIEEMDFFFKCPFYKCERLYKLKIIKVLISPQHFDSIINRFKLRDEASKTGNKNFLFNNYFTNNFNNIQENIFSFNHNNNHNISNKQDSKNQNVEIEANEFKRLDEYLTEEYRKYLYKIRSEKGMNEHSKIDKNSASAKNSITKRMNMMNCNFNNFSNNENPDFNNNIFNNQNLQFFTINNNNSTSQNNGHQKRKNSLKQQNIIEFHSINSFFEYNKTKGKYCRDCNEPALFDRYGKNAIKCLNCLRVKCKYCYREIDDNHFNLAGFNYCKVFYRRQIKLKYEFNSLNKTKLQNFFISFVLYLISYILLIIAGLFYIRKFLEKLFLNQNKLSIKKKNLKPFTGLNLMKRKTISNIIYENDKNNDNPVINNLNNRNLDLYQNIINSYNHNNFPSEDQNHNVNRMDINISKNFFHLNKRRTQEKNENIIIESLIHRNAQISRGKQGYNDSSSNNHTQKIQNFYEVSYKIKDQNKYLLLSLKDKIKFIGFCCLKNFLFYFLFSIFSIPLIMLSIFSLPFYPLILNILALFE